MTDETIEPSLAESRSRDDEWRQRYFEARDALFQFKYPPDPKLLREIADEIDCGNDCAHGYTEWDTNAHVCSRSERKEGCAGEKASCLRQFADAIDARSRAAVDPTGGVTSPDYVMVPREPTQEMLDEADRARALPEGYIRDVYRAMIAAAPRLDDGSGLTPHSTAVSAIAQERDVGKGCSPLPWEVDTIDNQTDDGTIKSYAIFDANGRVIMDALNSSVIEINTEHDGEPEGFVRQWDEQSRKDAELIVAAVNAFMDRSPK